ncbi:MAG TPA: RDD family protein [Phycisphaerae bacterium]|nr:RDD family protein [Phycisphaerae bacterium]
MRLHPLYLAALTVALCSWAAQAAGPATGLSAAGDDAVTWAWQRITTDQNEHRLIVTYTRAEDSQPQFMLLPMRPTGAEVPIAAVRDGYLHIFFKDGTHYRMRTPTVLDQRDPNAKFDYPEIQLPDRRVPRALCGDDAKNALYAIVPSTTAQRIAEKATPEADTNGAASPTPSPAPSPSPAPGPELTASKWSLVAYIPTDWSVVAPLPKACDAQTAVWVASLAGTPHVLFVAPDAKEQVQHVAWESAGWKTLPPVADVRADDVAGVFALKDALVVVTHSAAADDGKITLVPHVWKDDVWKAGATLKLKDAELHVPQERYAVARLGDGLIAIWPKPEAEAGELQAAKWPADGGAAVGDPVPVMALQGAAGALEEERTRFLITLAAMTFMVLIIMRARRDSFVTDLPVPEGYVLARLGPRAIAFFLDAAAVMLVAFPILFVPWFADHGVVMDQRMQERVQLAYAQDPDGVYWRWMIATLMFALYCIAFEATLGATPGKLAMRLRVYNHRAERASFAAVVVRNLLRFEIYPMFHFFPIIVLVLFTRNRQRLGDLAANTIVVEKAVATP